jgi:hypothetical protein
LPQAALRIIALPINQAAGLTIQPISIEPTAAGCGFYDEKSRASVTLQSSEIVEIPKEAFDSGMRE